jgi:hypothetical protein
MEVGSVRIGYLEALTNLNLQNARESFCVTAREVGAVLTNLGFAQRKRRTNTGWLLWLGRETQKQIHDLVLLNEVETLANLSMREAIRSCDICQEFRM